MKITELERLLKVLANRRRIAILDLLRKKRRMNVTEISAAIRLSFTSTSKHLTMLERAGFIEKEQQSLNMIYSISPDASPLLSKVISHL